MKIALVILHADPARGGAERYTIDLAAALSKRGHEISLLASSFDQIPPGVKTETIPAEGVTRLGKYRGFLQSLDQHREANRYDIVHAMLPVRSCDLYHPHAGLAAEAIEQGHRKHEGLLKRNLAKFANRMNLKRQRFAAVEADLLTGPHKPIVLCLSEYVKKTVRAHFNLPEDRLATLFNAVDLERFDPDRAKAGELTAQLRGKTVALMIAQDFARKGLRPTIESLAKLNNPTMVLLVVGKEDPRAYQELAQGLGIADRVIFAGSTKDTFPFYAAADFFVLPTRHDPCSLVVLESLAMGVPVISTIYNGACEIMTDGVHGFVLRDPSDVPALSNVMNKLADPSFRDRARQACLELRPKLSYGKHLDALLGIYQKSISTRQI